MLRDGKEEGGVDGIESVGSMLGIFVGESQQNKYLLLGILRH